MPWVWKYIHWLWYIERSYQFYGIFFWWKHQSWWRGYKTGIFLLPEETFPFILKMRYIWHHFLDQHAFANPMMNDIKTKHRLPLSDKQLISCLRITIWNTKNLPRIICSVKHQVNLLINKSRFCIVITPSRLFMIF